MLENLNYFGIPMAENHLLQTASVFEVGPLDNLINHDLSDVSETEVVVGVLAQDGQSEGGCRGVEGGIHNIQNARLHISFINYFYFQTTRSIYVENIIDLVGLVALPYISDAEAAWGHCPEILQVLIMQML